VSQLSFFSEPASLPPGFIYRPGFITLEEEQRLIPQIAALGFEQIRMRGVLARRRTVSFGWDYEFETYKLTPGPSIPHFLIALRERLPELTGRAAEEFGEVLVTEYAPGAAIGWHRDAPPFDIIAGISLAGECTMRFRPYLSAQASPTLENKKREAAPRRRSLALVLEPRSAYVIAGEARTRWQHHIPPTRTLRYSITFRTLRKNKRA
jgi:alkylated DNA repair dioxygenase AlkB